MDPGTAVTLASVAKEFGEKITDSIDYWSEFNGKRIDIREYRLQRDAEGNYIEQCHITRGTVKSVIDEPAGFILEDVGQILEEGVVNRKKYGSGGEEIFPVDSSDMKLREVEEKFVSFSSIDEIELTEVAESADSTKELDPESDA
jgi:hypothetical protein